MNKSKLFLIGGFIIILIISSKFFLSNKNEVKVEPSQINQQISPTISSSQDVIKEIQIEAGSFYYKPSEIRIKKGEKVKVVMKSVSMMHNFIIDELNVSMPIVTNGDTGVVEFIANKVGEFEYYCSVGQHRQNGQVGKLIVE